MTDVVFHLGGRLWIVGVGGAHQGDQVILDFLGDRHLADELPHLDDIIAGCDRRDFWSVAAAGAVGVGEAAAGAGGAGRGEPCGAGVREEVATGAGAGFDFGLGSDFVSTGFGAATSFTSAGAGAALVTGAELRDCK